MNRPLSARVVLAHIHRSGIYTTHPRDARRARILWALSLAWCVLLIVAALTGCADAHGVRARAPTPEDPSPPEPEPELEPTFLALDGLACTGHWLENEDVGTRLQAHPDTGLCTLPCQIVGPQRNTCTPEHRVHLAALCAELRGACTLASDGLSYCEAL